MIPRVLRSIKRAFPDRHPVRMLWHRCKAVVAAACYGFPARKLRIVCITGTDGKTTTVAMTAHILHAYGVRVGAVSTSFFRVREKTDENPTHKTSLSPFALQAFLRRCAREGCSTVVVEASSHGLVQHRLDFVWPFCAAITNISPEHLDYHGSMEQYMKDKAILFRMLRPDGGAVLNADDRTYASYKEIPAAWRLLYSSTKTFGTPSRPHECGLWAQNVSLSPAGSTADVRCNAESGTWRLRLKIPGRFNVENALCAVSCAHVIGVPLGKAIAALENFPGVPGRMERIDEGQPFSVLVDFTVTPKAYKETLAAARAMLGPNGKLLVLTGSCGNRMPEKRPMIGKIVSESADVVVVSEDETVTEDPQKVIDEVWAGIDQAKTDARKIFDRREGIRYLFSQAKPGDIVLLCGMGACTTMQTREGLRPWDERQVARDLLKEMRNEMLEVRG